MKKSLILLTLILLTACIIKPLEATQTTSVDSYDTPKTANEQAPDTDVPNEGMVDSKTISGTGSSDDKLFNRDTTNEVNMNNTIIIETTKGTIEIELNEDKAPITVKNFKRYVSEGHYQDTVFHRVIKGFMIQGGGFTQQGQKPTHDPIPIESDNGLKNSAGTIAMARTSDPNSATAQFFINTVDNAFLDYAPGSPGYTVFGKVTKGMDVVKAIENVQTKNSPMPDWPVEAIKITKVYPKVRDTT